MKEGKNMFLTKLTGCSPTNSTSSMGMTRNLGLASARTAREAMARRAKN